MVSEVIDGSPAQKANVQPGDLLLTFDRHELGGVDDLHRLLTAERAGRECALTIVRGSKLEPITVVPEARN
jgi:serine protease Do